MKALTLRLSERLGAVGQPDNFTLLRLCAALLVIYGHCFALALNPQAQLDVVGRLVGGTYTGSIGVEMFFFISGLFVTHSWLRKPDLMHFVRARALRLIPALACCLLLTVYVLGPLLTELPLASYFNDPRTSDYLKTNLKFGEMAYALPGVFLQTQQAGVVNGSLWSLPLELRCYVALAIAAVLGLGSKRWLSNLCLALLAIRFAGSWVRHEGVFEHEYQKLFPYFLLGAACAMNARWVPLHGGWLLLSLLATWLSHGTYLFHPLLGLSICYFCLWFGYCPRLPRVDRFGDLSYGSYLYGYPVQQTLVTLFPLWTPHLLFLPAVLVVLPIAAASWWLIERPALRLKGRPAAQQPRPELTIYSESARR